jgi:hypothetical protein
MKIWSKRQSASDQGVTRSALQNAASMPVFSTDRSVVTEIREERKNLPAPGGTIRLYGRVWIIITSEFELTKEPFDFERLFLLNGISVFSSIGL